jgi:hypothetical protein
MDNSKSKSNSKSIVTELKEKYQIVDILKKRYNNDPEILDFYNTYYNDLEEVENKSNLIWKLFGSMWKEEKQEIILEILNLILILEKQYLNMKKYLIHIKSKKLDHPKIKEDIQYLRKLVEKNKNTNEINIDIKSSFHNLEEKYNLKQQQFKEEIEKEYIRITNDTNDMNNINQTNQTYLIHNINNLKIS